MSHRLGIRLHQLLVTANIVMAFALCVAATAAGTESTRPAEEKAGESKPPKLTDAQIRKLLIAESIAAYQGNCPCPYSRASNGSRCGKRSAHSRPGGESPLCYSGDVTDRMVKAYRERG